MDVDIDIYDLDEFDEVQRAKSSELLEWETKFNEASQALEQERIEKTALNKKLATMRKNFQLLLDTAKEESKRKDLIIADLRREKDNIFFRRQKNKAFRNIHNHNVAKERAATLQHLNKVPSDDGDPSIESDLNKLMIGNEEKRASSVEHEDSYRNNFIKYSKRAHIQNPFTSRQQSLSPKRNRSKERQIKNRQEQSDDTSDKLKHHSGHRRQSSSDNHGRDRRQLSANRNVKSDPNSGVREIASKQSKGRSRRTRSDSHSENHKSHLTSEASEKKTKQQSRHRERNPRRTHSDDRKCTAKLQTKSRRHSVGHEKSTKHRTHSPPESGRHHQSRSKDRSDRQKRDKEGNSKKSSSRLDGLHRNDKKSSSKKQNSSHISTDCRREKQLPTGAKCSLNGSEISDCHRGDNSPLNELSYDELSNESSLRSSSPESIFEFIYNYNAKSRREDSELVQDIENLVHKTLKETHIKKNNNNIAENEIISSSINSSNKRSDSATKKRTTASIGGAHASILNADRDAPRKIVSADKFSNPKTDFSPKKVVNGKISEPLTMPKYFSDDILTLMDDSDAESFVQIDDIYGDLDNEMDMENDKQVMEQKTSAVESKMSLDNFSTGSKSETPDILIQSVATEASAKQTVPQHVNNKLGTDVAKQQPVSKNAIEGLEFDFNLQNDGRDGVLEEYTKSKSDSGVDSSIEEAPDITLTRETSVEIDETITSNQSLSNVEVAMDSVSVPTTTAIKVTCAESEAAKSSLTNNTNCLYAEILKTKSATVKDEVKSRVVKKSIEETSPLQQIEITENSTMSEPIRQTTLNLPTGTNERHNLLQTDLVVSIKDENVAQTSEVEVCDQKIPAVKEHTTIPVTNEDNEALEGLATVASEAAKLEEKETLSHVKPDNIATGKSKANESVPASVCSTKADISLSDVYETIEMELDALHKVGDIREAVGQIVSEYERLKNNTADVNENVPILNKNACGKTEKVNKCLSVKTTSPDNIVSQAESDTTKQICETQSRGVSNESKVEAPNDDEEKQSKEAEVSERNETTSQCNSDDGILEDTLLPEVNAKLVINDQNGKNNNAPVFDGLLATNKSVPSAANGSPNINRSVQNIGKLKVTIKEVAATLESQSGHAEGGDIVFQSLAKGSQSNGTQEKANVAVNTISDTVSNTEGELNTLPSQENQSTSIKHKIRDKCIEISGLQTVAEAKNYNRQRKRQCKLENRVTHVSVALAKSAQNAATNIDSDNTTSNSNGIVTSTPIPCKKLSALKRKRKSQVVMEKNVAVGYINGVLTIKNTTEKGRLAKNRTSSPVLPQCKKRKQDEASVQADILKEIKINKKSSPTTCKTHVIYKMQGAMNSVKQCSKPKESQEKLCYSESEEAHAPILAHLECKSKTTSPLKQPIIPAVNRNFTARLADNEEKPQSTPLPGAKSRLRKRKNIYRRIIDTSDEDEKEDAKKERMVKSNSKAPLSSTLINDGESSDLLVVSDSNKTNGSDVLNASQYSIFNSPNIQATNNNDLPAQLLAEVHDDLTFQQIDKRMNSLINSSGSVVDNSNGSLLNGSTSLSDSFKARKLCDSRGTKYEIEQVSASVFKCVIQRRT